MKSQFSTVGSAATTGESRNADVLPAGIIRAEHIALNVLDPIAAVKWYTENLGMKVMRQGGPPTNTSFIADSGLHMMLEIGHNAECPVIDFAKVSHMSIHLAFMVDDISTTKAKLIAAGATVVEDITRTPGGDDVLMMRDPSGLPIQFVKRVTPMLK